MRHLRYALLGSTLGVAVACASSPPPTSDAPAADVEVAEPSSQRDELVWTGSLQPMNERTGNLSPSPKQNKAYGSIRLQPTERDLNRMAVNIVISTPLQNPGELRWAILPGRCGSASLPVVGYEHFPIIEVGTNGRGELTTELPFTLPYDGSFHANIYWGDRSQPGTSRLQNVLTCANLRRSG